MSELIHPTAIIDPASRIDPTVSVGAFSVIGANVSIGAYTKIGSHCVIDGHTTIGEHNNFYRFCSIGGMPQDKKYADEPTKLTIGDRNTVREYVTINTGTQQDVGVTRVGSDNWIMAYVHIAHDCQVGDNTILANGVQLGGHVHVEDWAILGGLTAVHQFCRVGAHSMTGGHSALRLDVPPFVMAAGNPCSPVGINAEGLKRRGFSTQEIAALKEGYKIIYRNGLVLADACDALRVKQQAEPSVANALQVFLDFFAISTRGILRP